MQKTTAIKMYILEHVKQHPENIVAITTKHFGVTRTTVHRHLKNLIKQGDILKSGKTRNIRYTLKSSMDRELSYKINSQLSEFLILKTDFEDIFCTFKENIYDICIYGFTEIVNNAIDHSHGSNLTITTHCDKKKLVITIQDDGVGIFQNILDYFKLNSILDSVLQLSKGKMTTDPSRHSGEGIFFTSRAFDVFEIYANQLHYFRDNRENDWAFESLAEPTIGSTIRMSIHDTASTNLVMLFKQYQDPEDLSFNRTDIRVQLSQFGHEPLISRSQAKRITVGLEKFNHITLDFSGVRLVGQGFVDEMFCLFQAAHPHITIDYIHATPDVTFMIKRGIATRS